MYLVPCPTRGLWWLITFCWKSWPIFSLCIGTFLFLWQKKNFKTPKQKTNGYHKCFVLVWVTVTVFVCCKGGHLAFSAVFNKNKLKFLRKKSIGPHMSYSLPNTMFSPLEVLKYWLDKRINEFQSKHGQFKKLMENEFKG